MNFEIKTDRLFLRPIQQQDVSDIFEVTQKYPEIIKFMSWEIPKEMAETQAFFEMVQKNFPKKQVVWSIFFEGEFAGIISLDDISEYLGRWKIDKAEMGYWMSPEFHGRGFMTEAGKSVIDFGLNQLKLHKITVSHVLENKASQKVIEKFGFCLTGVQKSHLFYFGRWWDLKSYEILKHNFLSS